jgi:hypothetical protein
MADQIVPTHIYVVKVFRVVNNGLDWIGELERRTSAQSALGAMRGIIESETAKEMLKNQRAINAEDQDQRSEPA